MKSGFVTTSVVFMLMASPGIAEQPLIPDADFPYQAQRSHPVTYQVDYSVVITAPHGTKKLRVWVPIPPSDRGQKMLRHRISTFPKEIKPQINIDKTYGNKMAYLEWDHPKGAQIIRQRFTAKVYELKWHIKPGRAQHVSQWPTSFAPYLQPSATLVMNDAIRRQLRSIVPSTKGPSDDLNAIMEWVQANLTYDHAHASLKASSLHAIQERRGHCSDYHGLCAAFGRALGYPTRVTYGLHLFEKSSPSHCKLEVFLPPYGWVSFDVSETQKLIQVLEKEPLPEAREKKNLIAMAQKRLLQGFRDNTWLLQTRGTDLNLVPPSKHRPAVIRTIYAEADGEPLPDPDPANPKKTEHAWMTVIKVTQDQKVPYPFKDWKTLCPPGERKD